MRNFIGKKADDCVTIKSDNALEPIVFNGSVCLPISDIFLVGLGATDEECTGGKLVMMRGGGRPASEHATRRPAWLGAGDAADGRPGRCKCRPHGTRSARPRNRKEPEVTSPRRIRLQAPPRRPDPLVGVKDTPGEQIGLCLLFIILGVALLIIAPNPTALL